MFRVGFLVMLLVVSFAAAQSPEHYARRPIVRDHCVIRGHTVICNPYVTRHQPFVVRDPYVTRHQPFVVRDPYVTRDPYTTILPRPYFGSNYGVRTLR